MRRCGNISCRYVSLLDRESPTSSNLQRKCRPILPLVVTGLLMSSWHFRGLFEMHVVYSIASNTLIKSMLNWLNADWIHGLKLHFRSLWVGYVWEKKHIYVNWAKWKIKFSCSTENYLLFTRQADKRDRRKPQKPWMPLAFTINAPLFGKNQLRSGSPNTF